MYKHQPPPAPSYDDSPQMSSTSRNLRRMDDKYSSIQSVSYPQGIVTHLFQSIEDEQLQRGDPRSTEGDADRKSYNNFVSFNEEEEEIEAEVDVDAVDAAAAAEE